MDAFTIGLIVFVITCVVVFGIIALEQKRSNKEKAFKKAKSKAKAEAKTKAKAEAKALADEAEAQDKILDDAWAVIKDKAEAEAAWARANPEAAKAKAVAEAAWAAANPEAAEAKAAAFAEAKAMAQARRHAADVRSGRFESLTSKLAKGLKATRARIRKEEEKKDQANDDLAEAIAKALRNRCK